MIIPRSVVPPQPSFVELSKRHEIAGEILTESDVIQPKDLGTFGILDLYIDDAVTLNGDFVLACPNEISGIGRSEVDESGDFVEYVNRRSRIEYGRIF